MPISLLGKVWPDYLVRLTALRPWIGPRSDGKINTLRGNVNWMTSRLLLAGQHRYRPTHS
jgi:hypothetical protein